MVNQICKHDHVLCRFDFFDGFGSVFRGQIGKGWQSLTAIAKGNNDVTDEKIGWKHTSSAACGGGAGWTALGTFAESVSPVITRHPNSIHT